MSVLQQAALPLLRSTLIRRPPPGVSGGHPRGVFFPARERVGGRRGTACSFVRLSVCRRFGQAVGSLLPLFFTTIVIANIAINYHCSDLVTVTINCS